MFPSVFMLRGRSAAGDRHTEAVLRICRLNSSHPLMAMSEVGRTQCLNLFQLDQVVGLVILSFAVYESL
jgi:hypothetical protein